MRTSTRGGMAHACELETSICLAIDPAAVVMELAVDERSYDKGRALLEAAVAECVAYVDELLAKPPPERHRPATGS